MCRSHSCLVKLILCLSVAGEGAGPSPFCPSFAFGELVPWFWRLWEGATESAKLFRPSKTFSEFPQKKAKYQRKPEHLAPTLRAVPRCPRPVPRGWKRVRVSTWSAWCPEQRARHPGQTGSTGRRWTGHDQSHGLADWRWTRPAMLRMCADGPWPRDRPERQRRTLLWSCRGHSLPRCRATMLNPGARRTGPGSGGGPWDGVGVRCKPTWLVCTGGIFPSCRP